uniref:Uncharacterized protein n=1 Tax=Panagrolaimus sp. ES5 TaxID=591445 RepID=A0AC34FNZ4_9BILA
MKTEDNFLSSLKEKQNLFVGSKSNDQYSNLNLNKAFQNAFKQTLKSKTFSNDSRRGAGVESYDDFGFKKDSYAWNKSDKHLTPISTYADYGFGKKYEFKKSKDSNAKSGSLSLHISDYENSIEADSDGSEKEAVKNQSDFPILMKKWNVATRNNVNQNPFEFPRQQQEDEQQRPSVMEFRGSQTLYNPNSDGSRRKPPARQQKQDRLINAVEEVALFFERGECNKEEFINRLNAKHADLGYQSSQVYKAWRQVVSNVEKRFRSHNNVFEKATDERIALIQRKFQPDFCQPGTPVTNEPPNALAAVSPPSMFQSHHQNIIQIIVQSQNHLAASQNAANAELIKMTFDFMKFMEKK